MQLAADSEILALTVELDHFPYRALSKPFADGRAVASGIARLDGVGKTYIHQALTYRKIWLQSPQSERRITPLVQIDQYAALLEFDGPSLLDDADFAEANYSADDLEASNRPIIIANVRPSDGAGIDYFNARHPYLPSPNSMAFMDIVLEEYEAGAPVFYDLLPRPDRALVLDITHCLTEGEILDSAKINGSGHWRQFLSDPENHDGEHLQLGQPQLYI